MSTLQALMQLPGAANLIEDLLQGAFGAPGFGLRYTTYDPSKTLEYNVAAQRRTSTLQGQLYGTFTNTSQQVTTQAITNLYRTLGFNQQAAIDAAKGAQGSLIHDVAEMFFVRPQLQAAYANIGNALYNRSSQWDPNAIHRRGGLTSQQYWEHGQQLLDDVIKSGVNKEFGGMGVKDISVITAELINNGALDNVGKTGGYDDITNRINKVKRELKSYAESVHILQDVIDGPVEDIIDTFEAMTGNKMVSMSTGRVEALSTQIRNVLSRGVVSAAELAQLTASQYGLIAPMGGSMAQANAMAISTAAALSAGHRVSGVSDQQLAQAYAVDNTQRMLSGETRTIAAAYQVWLDKNGLKDNSTNKERFFTAMRKNGRSIADNASDYVRSNNVDPAFMGSALVTDTTADADFYSASRADDVSRYRKFTESLVNGVDESKRATVRQILNSTYNPREIQERLRTEAKMGLNEAAAFTDRVLEGAMIITRTTNDREAMATLSTAENAENITRMNQASDYFKKIRGIKTASGAEGLINTLLGKSDDKGYGAARMFSAILGMDNTAAVEFSERVAGAATPEAKRAVLEDVAKAAGVSGNDLNQMLEQAKSLGDVGERILFTQAKAGTSPEAALKQRRLLMDALKLAGTTDKSGKPVLANGLSMEQINMMTEGLNVSDDEKARYYLKGQGYSADMDQAKKFREIRSQLEAERTSAYSSATGGELANVDDASLDQIAASRVAQKTLGQLAYASSIGKGSEGREKAKKDLAISKAFREQVDIDRAKRHLDKASEEDYLTAASEAMQQDGIMGMLQHILTAVEALAKSPIFSFGRK